MSQPLDINCGEKDALGALALCHAEMRRDQEDEVMTTQCRESVSASSVRMSRLSVGAFVQISLAVESIR